MADDRPARVKDQRVLLWIGEATRLVLGFGVIAFLGLRALRTRHALAVHVGSAERPALINYRYK